MAFPSLAEIKSNVAVKEEPGSAPVAESSAPTPDPSTPDGEDTGSVTEPTTETASAEPGQEPSAESQDAATPENGKDSDRIPYNRFKEKVDQVNTLKETNELLAKQLETLKSGALEAEKEPEPEAPDPLLERINSLDEYDSESDMVAVMKDMAEELKTLRSKASRSEQGVNEIRVAEKIQVIESEIKTVTSDIGVHDSQAARFFILQNLSQDPNQEVKDLAGKFHEWEKTQEGIVLERLGLSRPASGKAPAQEATPDTPPRPETAGVSEPSSQKQTKKPTTLKDLRKTLGVGRRR